MVEKDTERRKARENVRAASQSLEPSEVRSDEGSRDPCRYDGLDALRPHSPVARLHAGRKGPSRSR